MHSNSRRIAIIGAGLTGLAAARHLKALGYIVTVLEQNNVWGGRAATERLHGCVVDTGAQYLRLPDSHPMVRQLVREDLPAGDLIDIARPVWIFDGTGAVRSGDEQQNAEPKWTYRQGMDELGRLLALDVDARAGHRATGIQRSGDGYVLAVGDERSPVEADMVLVTSPAPETVRLLDASDVGLMRFLAARALLDTVAFRPIVSVTLGYAAGDSSDFAFPGGSNLDPRPYYALVNIDRAHPISWLAFENDKGPDRVPDGMTVLVTHMGPDWSRRHWEDDDTAVAVRAVREVTRLLGDPFSQPLWHDVRRWPYALPDNTCALDDLNRDHQGLLFAGDYVAGGRLHLALQAGLDVAAMIEHDDR